LKKEGFAVISAFDGREALRVFSNDSFDLIILDLMLPRLNGMDFLQMVRQNSTVPILIVSAKDTDVDKALGLGFGADDYISKPFSMIELTARVKASIRRHTFYSAPAKEPSTVITIGSLEIDIKNISAKKNGTVLNLTSKEFEILKLFMSHPERVFTKMDIHNSIWDDNYYTDDNTINVHIRRLRKK
ncbi:MAG: response regulator transcription factor, partial [Proteobacteria bacterium]|nr:response regulator transcription factor [Pseudomonadota bacterium]